MKEDIMEEKVKVLTEPYVLNKRTEIVFKYIEAYNEMNVEGMIADFADDIVFLNVMNGENTMELKGIEEFKKQAIDALSYFSAREQAIVSMTHLHSSTEIVINYRAVAAKDFPNGLKKGDEIKLKGKSIFQFAEDGIIIKLTDIVK